MARTKRTLQEIDQEITRLQDEAAKIRDAEKADVIAKIRQAVAYYGITAADIGLGAGGRKARKAGVKAKSARKASAVKFKDGTGRTWSGHGRRPQWFIDALAAGKTEADLRA